MDLSSAPEISLAQPAALTLRSDADERVAAIYAAHYQKLVGLATMLGGGLAIGEEIAQETFVIALRRERREPGYLTEPVWPWLRITAARLAGRNRQQLLREALTYRLRRPDADTSAAWEGETIDLVRALRRLPRMMRLCVILSHVEDQSTPHPLPPCSDAPPRTSTRSSGRDGHVCGNSSVNATTATRTRRPP
jgi:DNA-directed RNA polymerase specialized sigma24 family protein